MMESAAYGNEILLAALYLNITVHQKRHQIFKSLEYCYTFLFVLRDSILHSTL